MTGLICGTGSCIPKQVMDNFDIAELVQTSDEWIRERTGVVKRHIVKTETTVSMAADAGKKAIEDAGIRPEEVELILVATISSDVLLPCTACEVQKQIGAVNAVCFDLNAACCGFIFAYQTALAYLHSGMYRTILVIGSESLSNIVNWKDRSTCILFGDGAGAAVVRAGEGRTYRSISHSDGNKGAALTCQGKSGVRKLNPELGEGLMKMDGKAVFQFALRRVPEVIREVLDANQMTEADIDLFILHQANQRIVEGVAKRLDADTKKFPVNIQEYGNTSSASIPILLDELHRSQRLKKGDRIVIAGFGAGLSWGAGIVDWVI